MTLPTALVPAQLAADLAATLTRLRMARTMRDQREEWICEQRLNWLIERIPRTGRSAAKVSR